MPDIDDDDFIRRYEGALIHYTATYNHALDIISPWLDYTDKDDFSLTLPTAIGGGLFRRHFEVLEWLYPAGIAIRARGFLLSREYGDRERLKLLRQEFYTLLSRWRRNRY